MDAVPPLFTLTSAATNAASEPLISCEHEQQLTPRHEPRPGSRVRELLLKRSRVRELRPAPKKRDVA